LLLQFRTYTIKAGKGGAVIPLILCDTMGLEENTEAGLDVEDLVHIFKGHVKDRYQVSDYNRLRGTDLVEIIMLAALITKDYALFVCSLVEPLNANPPGHSRLQGANDSEWRDPLCGVCGGHLQGLPPQPENAGQVRQHPEKDQPPGSAVYNNIVHSYVHV